VDIILAAMVLGFAILLAAGIIAKAITRSEK
jgi:hypothetical protein